MLQKHTIIIIFFYTIVKCFGAANWELPVTPFCLPIIEATVHEFNQKEFVSKIIIAHELIYDGLNYKSLCFFPALASRLIKANEEGFFIWRDLNGNEIHLATASANGRFIISQKRSNCWLLEDRELKRSYEYENCLLKKIIENSKIFNFEYEKNCLVRICRSQPTFEVLAILDYNELGLLKEVTFGGHEFIIKCNFENGIISCNDKISGLELFGSEYNNYLLVHWWKLDCERSYRWGEVAWRPYAVPIFTRSPIIIEDELYTYKAEANFRQINFFCQSKTRRKKQTWRYEFLSKKIYLINHNTEN